MVFKTDRFYFSNDMYREGQLLEITVGELPLFSFKAVSVVLLSFFMGNNIEICPPKIVGLQHQNYKILFKPVHIYKKYKIIDDNVNDD